MGKEGVGWLFLIIGCGLAFTLIPFLGTPVAWGLLPFDLAAIGLLGWLLIKNYRAAELEECLTLAPTLMRVERREPSGKVLTWEANPHWVKPRLHRDHKVENYLTLRGAGREIELGAFLTPNARSALYYDIIRALGRLSVQPN